MYLLFIIISLVKKAPNVMDMILPKISDFYDLGFTLLSDFGAMIILFIKFNVIYIFFLNKEVFI